MSLSQIKLYQDKPLRREFQVFEAEYEGKRYAAKALNISTTANWDKIVQEVKKLQTLKHPNIIKYYKIQNDPQSGRVLLMEFMNQNLTEYLERESSCLSFTVQVNLCHDISKALSYLHSQGIIHGNLTSSNILITEDYRAKVSDYGRVALTTLGVLYRTNNDYLPLKDPYAQGDKTDVFSFGVLVIQILNQQQPNPSNGIDNEEDRWQSEIDKIESSHPLRPIFLKCIKEEDRDRPQCEWICKEVESLRQSQVYTELSQLVRDKQKLSKEVVDKDKMIAEFCRLPLSLPSKKWSRSQSASKQMRRSADAITDGFKVYIRRSHVKEVHIFNLRSEQWDETPMYCEHYRSSLVIVDTKIIAVGGTSNNADGFPCSNELMHISPTGNTVWKHMKHPRSRATSITCQYGEKNLLVVAGGEHPVGIILTTVEVLNITTNTWSNACPLPETRYSCSAAIVMDSIYLLGGWKGREKATREVLRCTIDSLLKSCNSPSPDQTWENLATELPVAQATCVSFNNQLLTFGGTWCYCYNCYCNRPTRDIYTYDEENEDFECIGSTPIAQYLCFACVFEGNKIFVAGGAENENESLKDVYILKY